MPAQPIPTFAQPANDLAPILQPHQVLEALPCAVLALSRQGRFTLVNGQAAFLLGCPAEALVGQPLAAALPAEVPEALRLSLHEAVGAGQSVSGKFFLPHCQRWIEMSTQPSGQEVLVFWHDITELEQQRQQCQALADGAAHTVWRWAPGPPGMPQSDGPEAASATAQQDALVAGQADDVLAISDQFAAFQREEMLLRNRHDLLETIFNHSSLALHLLRSVRDETGRIVDFEVALANPLADAMGGRPLLGLRMLADWPHTREMGLFDEAVGTVESGQPMDLEHSFNADGAHGWFRWTAVKLDDGLVMAIENITVRKESELAAHAGKDLLNAIFNATLDSLEVLKSVRDESGAIADFEWVLTNEAAHRLLRRRNIVGQRLLTQEPRMRPSGVFAKYCQVVNKQQPLNFELAYPEPNAETWYHVVAAPFADGLVVTWHNITARKRATAELLRLQLAQQQQLANAVLEAQEVERRRIAEALHNGLGQLLYATQLQLELLPNLADAAATAATHRKAMTLLQTAIAQTRTLSHELIPTILEDFGLVAALREVCRNCSTPTLRLTCVADALPPIPPTLSLALYRMAQELVNNIVKHAQASTATLSVFMRNGWLVLQAQDNGRGFDPALPRRPGIGISAVRDRAKLLNGQFRVKSSLGKGTLVSVLLPPQAGVTSPDA